MDRKTETGSAAGRLSPIGAHVATRTDVAGPVFFGLRGTSGVLFSSDGNDPQGKPVVFPRFWWRC